MQATLHFDGPNLTTADEVRLTGQLKEVHRLLSDGEWHTLKEIAAFAHGSEAGCSARIRDLRKSRFGGYRIELKRATENGGTWLYRMVI
jgi:hypothetical protein